MRAAKFWIAGLGAVLQVGLDVVAAGHAPGWLQSSVAAMTAVLVYAVPNAAAPPPPAHLAQYPPFPKAGAQ